MRSKNFSAILIIFLVILVSFVVVQVVNIITQRPLPKKANVPVNQIDPTINQDIFSKLKGS